MLLIASFAAGAAYSIWYVWYALSKGKLPPNFMWRDGPPTREAMPVAFWTHAALGAVVATGFVFGVLRMAGSENLN